MKNAAFILILMGSLWACRHDHSHEQHSHSHSNHYHHHHDEDLKLLITGYSDIFEVFAEAEPLVAGNRSEIVTHITKLENYKPLTDATITLILRGEYSQVFQTREVAARDGIWYFWLTPEDMGETEVIFEIEKDGNKHTIHAGSITVFDDEHEAIHYAEDRQPHHPAAVNFTKEQSWLINFATDKVKVKELGIVIKTVGEILPARGDEIILTASTKGMVRFTNQNLYEGVELRAGETLMNISGEGLAEGNVNQQYLEAYNNYEKARADYERISVLAEANIASQRELLQARNNYENARLVFENLSAHFSKSGQTVKSPASGNLTALLVNHGQFVDAGQPLLTVARNSKIVIKAELQQRYAPHIQNLHTANLIDINGQAYNLEELGGTILSRPRNVDPRSHLLPVFLSIKNTNGWVTGSLLDVFLKTTDPESHLAVPNTALIEEQGNYFVFVQLHPESFEKREVFPSHTDGVHTAILAGVKEGERIVTRGAIIVKMAAAAGDLDPHSGHMH